jgi:chromosomal replication initiator protein
MSNKVYLDPSDIISITADYFKVPQDEVTNGSRKREYIKAKHIAMFGCRMFTDYSFAHIGELFHRDHATVMFALKSVENQASIYRGYRIQLNEIIEKLIHDEFSEPYKSLNFDNV